MKKVFSNSCNSRMKLGDDSSKMLPSVRELLYLRLPFLKRCNSILNSFDLLRWQTMIFVVAAGCYCSCYTEINPNCFLRCIFVLNKNFLNQNTDLPSVTMRIGDGCTFDLTCEFSMLNKLYFSKLWKANPANLLTFLLDLQYTALRKRDRVMN